MRISNVHLTSNHHAITFHKNTDSSGDGRNTASAYGSLKNLAQNCVQKATSSRERIQNMEKQKQEIQSSKAEYEKKAKASGVDQQTIDAQLAAYDSRISQINQEITQIQSESEIAIQAADSEQNQSNPVAAALEISKKQVDSAQQMMDSFLNQGSAQEYIAVVQSAQKLEARSYKQSKGSSEEYEKLEAGTDGLENKAGDIDKKIFAKTRDANQITALSEEKTAQEKAVENYKEQAGMADKASERNVSEMDLYA